MDEEGISNIFRENLKQYLDDSRLALITSLELYNESTNLYRSIISQLSQTPSHFEQGELVNIHKNAKRTVITQVSIYSFHMTRMFFNA